MAKVRVTKKKLRKLITDEKNASKEYRKYGFNRLAKDEARHRKFLLEYRKRNTK
jgi:hypothetical protein